MDTIEHVNAFQGPADGRVVELLASYMPRRGGWRNRGERCRMSASEAAWCIARGIAVEVPARAQATLYADVPTTDRMMHAAAKGKAK